jgi:AcrR family transcriptional regulator
MNPAHHEDGRIARRLENRVRIVDAVFRLLRNAQHPTLAEIAEVAGVTSRTLLNHFPDVGSLVLAAVQRGRQLADRDMPQVPTTGDAEARIRRFCTDAVPFYDTYSVIRWATLTFPGGLEGFDPRQGKSPVLNEVERRVCVLLKGAGFDLEGDTELKRAVLVMLDPLAWRLLRTQQGLSRPAAAAAMARGLLALGREAKRASRSR